MDFGDAIVIVYLQKWAPDSPPRTADEARAIIEDFALRDTEPIFDALGRSKVALAENTAR